MPKPRASASPVPSPVTHNKSATKDFFEAMKAVSLGEKVSRISWNKGEKEYGFLYNTFLSLHHENGMIQNWIVNDGDMEGTDWVVVK